MCAPSRTLSPSKFPYQTTFSNGCYGLRLRLRCHLKRQFVLMGRKINWGRERDGKLKKKRREGKMNGRQCTFTGSRTRTRRGRQRSNERRVEVSRWPDLHSRRSGQLLRFTLYPVSDDITHQGFPLPGRDRKNKNKIRTRKRINMHTPCILPTYCQKYVP